MSTAYDIPHLLILLVTGVAAGWINMLAGGGSNLTLPALMVLGLPADVANATNRVSVLLQGVVGMAGFRNHGQLPTEDLPAILLPLLLGGAIGAVAPSFAPIALLKPLLLGTMLTMTLVMLLKPNTVVAPAGSRALTVAEKPSARFWLLLAGMYGGFVQAGVGFILISVLGGALRYDLVRSNALKLVCGCAFTTIALAIFLAQDLVLWIPGLVLSVGTMFGAHAGVRFAISARADTLRFILFITTACGTVVALLSD